jgi:hypothetical protein
MADTSAWFALGGVLGGVMLTGLVSLATAGLSHRWAEKTRVDVERGEEFRTFRDQRRQACHSYLVATNSFYQAIDQAYLKACRGAEVDVDEHVRESLTALQDAYVYLTISCGARVRDLARSYNMALYELRNAAQAADRTAWAVDEPETHNVRDQLRDAMRSELGVRD